MKNIDNIYSGRGDLHTSYDLENSQIFSNTPLSNDAVNLTATEVPLIDPDLINMFHHRDNILQNSPGNFDIVSTHHDIKFEKKTLRGFTENHPHFFFPKRKEFHSTGRSRTKAVLSGKKVRHPLFQNATKRYKSRSKVPNSVNIEYTKQSVPIPNNEKDAALAQIFRDKFLNFIDPKGEQDMYVFSNHGSPKSTPSAKLFSSAINRRGRRPMTMGKNPSSPTNIGRRGNMRYKNKLDNPKINNTTHTNLHRKLIRSRETDKRSKKKEEEDPHIIPQHLFNFMKHASKELLNTNDHVQSQDNENSKEIITI